MTKTVYFSSKDVIKIFTKKIYKTSGSCLALHIYTSKITGVVSIIFLNDEIKGKVLSCNL